MKTTRWAVGLLTALALSVACSDEGSSAGSGDASAQDAIADVDLDAMDEAARALYQANAQRALEEAGIYNDSGHVVLIDQFEEGPCPELYEIISCTIYADSESPDINLCFVGQQLCWLDESNEQVWTDCVEPSLVNERIIISLSRQPSPT